ncbi:hypothetical protein ABMA27_008310 [Loxostege sticticalis]|uniref:Gustatory receptor n=1 Tax=Loxostege sticticalis TaxID=481309 RepID=A0ABR3HAT2_LOXSC
MAGGAHAFILRISSFFGLAPLRFEPCANGFTVSISNAMCIYSYILVSILILLAIYGQVAEIRAGLKLSVKMSSTMSQVVSSCDVLVVVVMAAVGVYGAPARMRNMLKLLDTIASVDHTLSGQYSAVTERKLSAVLLAPLIFFSLLLVDDFCFYVMQAKTVDREWNVVINYIGFYLLWLLVMVLELQFAFTALSVHARFRALNDVLALTACSIAVPVEKPRKPTPLNIFAIRVTPKDQRSDDVSWLMTSTPKRRQTPIVRRSVSGESRLLVSPSEAICVLASLHGTLCDLVHRIDDSYGIPLVMILISTLLHLIVTPYFFIMEIMVSAHRVHFLIILILWCATHLIRIFLVVEPSHYTIMEGKRTEGLVCRLMTSGTSAGLLSSRLELFSRQLMLRSVSYSPIGICTLDRPLVASILGAVTTYLVIVIQFQRNDT